ncbi:MAG: L-proline amide hydrolase [Mycobacterium sp.]|nr:L-proline amide hydrolase [Mycobacterium sp.]
MPEGAVAGPHGSLYYRIVGDADAVPLLVIHGGPGMPHDYLRDLDGLADARPVVYYDQLGCGRSDRPDDEGLWTVEAFADSIDTVRDALGLDRVHLVGQSAGGWIALEYALRRPAGLASLQLANTCASIPLFERGVARLRAALPGGAGAVINACESAGVTIDPEYLAAVGLFNRLHFSGTDDLPGHVLVALRDMNPAIYAAMVGTGLTFTGTMAGWDVTDRLGQLELPVLVTSGRFDEMTPEVVRDMADAIPGARMVIFERSAHLPMVTETAAFLGVVRAFLDSLGV